MMLNTILIQSFSINVTTRSPKKLFKATLSVLNRNYWFEGGIENWCNMSCLYISCPWPGLVIWEKGKFKQQVNHKISENQFLHGHADDIKWIFTPPPPPPPTMGQINKSCAMNIWRSKLFLWWESIHYAIIKWLVLKQLSYKSFAQAWKVITNGTKFQLSGDNINLCSCPMIFS